MDWGRRRMHRDAYDHLYPALVPVCTGPLRWGGFGDEDHSQVQELFRAERLSNPHGRVPILALSPLPLPLASCVCFLPPQPLARVSGRSSVRPQRLQPQHQPASPCRLGARAPRCLHGQVQAHLPSHGTGYFYAGSGG